MSTTIITKATIVKYTIVALVFPESHIANPSSPSTIIKRGTQQRIKMIAPSIAKKTTLQDKNGVNPKFRVNSIWGANRAKFI